MRKKERNKILAKTLIIKANKKWKVLENPK